LYGNDLGSRQIARIAGGAFELSIFADHLSLDE
jgi:hypothetical protein